MIQNTGGIYNDGATGLFLDLSTLTVEDVFEDGLQAKVKTMDVKSAKAFMENWIHVRYSVDGKAWALGQDGRWREIPSNTEDPASLTVYFIRQAMAEDAVRDRLSGEIGQIMETKKDNLGKTAPSDAIPLMDVEAPPQAPAVKEKGSVQNQSADTDTVTVTITEAPKVEITTTPPPQVDIT
ncbi:hypothetical protein [uncultured Dialister sp.]|uniref:hypothetical protein n=1 Tax=uncultured Dialister sp. TaxID=278064 RepID=UPI0026069741|nr:hypothetical protein [uncultured Dialister sp.]